MAFTRAVIAALLIVATLMVLAEARPFFRGLVSLDLMPLENGFSGIGSKGCEVFSNALAEDLAEFPEEAAQVRFRRCEWD